MRTSARWFPYLGDAVCVRSQGITLTGHTHRGDHTVVEVAAPLPGLRAGLQVQAEWRVGEEVHRGEGIVEDLAQDGGFTVRLTDLAQLATVPSRRARERILLTVPVAVLSERTTSATQASTLDISESGIKLALTGATVQVGERLAVDVALGRARDRRHGKVIWVDWQGFGRQIAGVRLDCDIEPQNWLEHLHHAS